MRTNGDSQHAPRSCTHTPDCEGNVLITPESNSHLAIAEATSTAACDELTGLRGHRAFQLELENAVEAACASGEELSLAIVDIDRLKFLNDCFGLEAGDGVLTRVARALDGTNETARAFRVGGDEFAVLMRGVSAAGATGLVEGCIDLTRLPGADFSITAGVATLRDEDAGDASVFWERATTALQEGKRSSRGKIVSFDAVEPIVTVVTPAKVTALCSLLEQPRMEIEFQPIWDLEHHGLLGVEALARPWPGYGFNGPAEMFAVAEKIGRAHELDAICVAAALSRAREVPPGALMFINVNPQSLVHGTVSAELLAPQLPAVGLLPQQVVIEITERSDARQDIVIERANRLREFGFQLALDDVGAGNAGLEMLCELPVNFVKLDRSVISKVLESVQARAVLISIALFAYRVDAYVIAEGIETADIFTFVKSAHHLDLMRDPPIKGAQGFLLGRPSSDLRGLPLSAEDALPKAAPPPLPLPPDSGDQALVA